MLVPEWVYDDSLIPDPYGYGENAVAWLKRLKHPKNPAPGHPFELDRWQERIIRRIYGPRHIEDKFDPATGIRIARKGQRIVRRVYLRLPRGNRKTSLGAAIGLLHLIGPERTPASRIVSAAASHQQAMELFNEAAMIVDNDKRLRKHLKVYAGSSKTSITFPANRGVYKAVAADGNTLHGGTYALVLADEVHVWEGNAGRRLWGALESAAVKIPDALFVTMTTAGRGQDTLAFEQDAYAVKVQKDEIDDPATLPVVFGLEKDDDWQDEASWLRVNPGMRYGYPDLASYRDAAQKAIKSPSNRDVFLQFNLNVWLEKTTSPFVEMEVYDKGNRPIPDDIDGRPAWIAVDMSTTTDLSAVAACIPHGDDFVVLPYFFCPADDIAKRGDRDGVNYASWAEQGFITPTPGNVVDYRAVETCIRNLCERFDVREIGFDKALAQPVMQPLLDDGLPVLTIEQKWQVQTPALRDLERVILQEQFIHAGHPVLRWNFGNIAVHQWGNGNRAFRKDKSADRIDGAVATWMAVSRAAAIEPVSAYDREDWTDDRGWV
ncbi:MAG: terminase TerL endonuclease subunit [Xanthobacteraceae bacterium]